MKKTQMKTTTEYLVPTRVMAYDNANHTETLIESKDLQIGLNEQSFVEIKKNGYIVLDYGKEISGGVRILNYHGNGNIRIRLGESYAEVNSDIGSFNATNDHSTRDGIFYISSYSDMQFFQSGFRFVRIDILSEETFKIKSVLAKFTYTNIKQIGTFKSSDKRMNDIFDTAAYTIKLNIQNDMIWDGIKRDRLVWVGDIHPEMLAATGLYKQTDFIENSLDFVQNQTSVDEWMNGIPMYSMWFLIILDDYYMKKNNLDYILSKKDYIYQLAKKLLSYTDEDGKTNYPYNFLDWPTHGKPDEIPGIEALNFWAIQSAKRLLSICQVDTSFLDVIKIENYANNSAKESKQAIALRILNKLPQSVNNLIDGQARGLSTFMSYYILKAIAETHSIDDAVDIMKIYYGGMLDLGATTFFEDFNIDWLQNAARIDEIPKNGQIDPHGQYGDYCYSGFRHSLCHGWSAGVIPFIQEKLLGISIIKPGYEEIKFNPHLLHFKWVKATIPTPFGQIKIEHKQNKTTIQLPKGIKMI